MTAYTGPRGSGSGTGNVVGPASSTDNAVALFDGATGELVQNSVTTIDPATGVVAGLVFPNTGVPIQDTNSTHNLLIVPGSNLTANRNLTVTTGDSNRGLTLTSDFTFDEGTFTPTITLGGAGNIPTFTTNTGLYTRIGNRYIVDVYLNGDGGTQGNSASNFYVALPATASASNPAGYFIAGVWVVAGTEYILGGVINPSATYIELFYWNVINQNVQIVGADVGATAKNMRLHYSFIV